MTDSSERILQVSPADLRGGAERIAWDLHRSFHSRGLAAWLAVGRKRSDDPAVLPIPAAGGVVEPLLAELRRREAHCPRWWKAGFAVRSLRDPRVAADYFRGIEDFRFPASHDVLELPPAPPDVLHLHNLHGSYFDLTVLPELSSRTATVVSLHDAWLLSGHCAHSFDCERWLTGCGECPDLTIYPPVRRDATALNWRRKRDVFAGSHLSVVVPCRWLLGRVERSILNAAIEEARVVPYGIDLRTFRPGDRAAARDRLGLPHDVPVFLFAANGIRRSVWRDYSTLRSALETVAADRRILFVALGEDASPERIGLGEIRFVPFVSDSAVVADHYRAADVYVHPALADTFPNAVLEALACGVPVVGTRVGGIPEQIADGDNGLLVERRDAIALARALVRLIDDDDLRGRLAATAASDAAARFDLDREVDEILDVYAAAIERHRRRTEIAAAS